MGCDDILIVTGSEHVGHFAEYLGDGKDYGVRLTYRVQPEAGGIGQALLCAEGFVSDHQLFPVILGDNYFGEVFGMPVRPTIFVKYLRDASRFGVYDPDANSIIEKPTDKQQGLAVTGLYVYDSKIFSILKRLRPSSRNEIEITDLNNILLDDGLAVDELEVYWSDLGTFDSLIETSNYEREKYAGLMA